MILALLLLYFTCCFTLLLAVKEIGIVYPTLLSTRGSDEQKVLKINETMILTLERSEVFSDDFIFISEANDKRVHHLMRKEDFEKDLFHDQQFMASLLVRTDDGLNVEGLLGERLRIKPMLEMARTEDGYIPHKLYEVPTMTKEARRVYKRANVAARSQRGTCCTTEARRKKDAYYPEIHIVQDWAHAKTFRFNKARVIHYFAIFVNAINLRFATIESIRIRIRITGITMTRNLEKYFVYAGDSYNEILDLETLDAFKKHYEASIEYSDSDLLFLITGRDMVFYENGTMENWVSDYHFQTKHRTDMALKTGKSRIKALLYSCLASCLYQKAGYSLRSFRESGQSYIGGVCQEDKVAMSEDPPGSYAGVQVTAHEIGHSLGCVHDGDPAHANLPGHKGSEKCSWYDGYIMSYEAQDRKQYRFSNCCVDDIKNLFSQSKWGCVKTLTRRPIVRMGLPGRRISGDEYCKRCFPKLAGMQYDEKFGIQDCEIICDNNKLRYRVGVPDGAPCNSTGNGKKCMLRGEY